MDQAGEEVWAGREAGVPWGQRCSPKEVGMAEWRWARLHVMFPAYGGGVVTADDPQELQGQGGGPQGSGAEVVG